MAPPLMGRPEWITDQDLARVRAHHDHIEQDSLLDDLEKEHPMSSNNGTVQFIPPEAQVVKMEQFNQEYAFALKSRQHLWVAVQSHVLSKMALKAEGGDGPLLLDNESLRMVATCCYICVLPYDASQLERKCKGEPR